MPISELMGNRVALVLDEPEKKALPTTAGGIITGTEAEEKKVTTATVKYVGDNIKQYKEGDRVFIGEFYGKEIDMEGEKVVLMKPEDIIAKL